MKGDSDMFDDLSFLESLVDSMPFDKWLVGRPLIDIARLLANLDPQIAALRVSAARDAWSNPQTALNHTAMADFLEHLKTMVFDAMQDVEGTVWSQARIVEHDVLDILV